LRDFVTERRFELERPDLGGLYEKDLTTGEVTTYYSAGGRMIAMRKGSEVSYLLADHLGTTTAVLDDEGEVLSSRAYWPYGGDRSMEGDQRLTARSYTGQREEDYDGLGLPTPTTRSATF
jgi:hypothetical protein